MARKTAGETVKYLIPEEINTFFRVITSTRDRAIFRVLYHRGFRASEVGKLRLSDYRPAAGRLYVHRLKGSNSGEYRLCALEQAALRAWLRERGTHPGPLFSSRNHRAISRRRLDELMKRYCAAAGIEPEKAHVHALKHSCGTHLLAIEGDITLVQDHLGHRNIQNTLIYSAISNKKRDEFAEQLTDWGRKAA